MGWMVEFWYQQVKLWAPFAECDSEQEAVAVVRELNERGMVAKATNGTDSVLGYPGRGMYRWRMLSQPR
jgi:hypothetical protein